MTTPPDYSSPGPVLGVPLAAPANTRPDSLQHDLARSYQPRRVWAAAVSIGWNLLLAGALVGSGEAVRLYQQMAPSASASAAALAWDILYLAILFAGYATLNFPLELWFGYLQERQFGLAKDGVRAWTRDWFMGTLQHGIMFVIGAAALLLCQKTFPTFWLVAAGAILLALFLLTTYLAADLIPIGLFHFERTDEKTTARLQHLAGRPLPPIRIYSHPALREFAGGIVGMANRKILLISRSTLELASDAMLRFVLRHDLGHQRYHHNLLSALAGWAWIVIGLVISHTLIPAHWYGAPVFATPVYIAFLAFTISLWMVIGEPVLAYLGRRLEYQADRHYLRTGGTLAQMQTALDELARQNLARTEAMRRRETLFHPLPSIANRLHRAATFESQSQRKNHE